MKNRKVKIFQVIEKKNERDVEFLELKAQVERMAKLKEELRDALEYFRLLSLQMEEIRSINRFSLTVLEETQTNFKILFSELFEEIQEIKSRDSHKPFDSFFLNTRKKITGFFHFVKRGLKRFGNFQEIIEPNAMDMLSHQNETLTIPIDNIKIEGVLLSRFEEFCKTQAPGVTFRIVQDRFDDARNFHIAKKKYDSRKIKNNPRIKGELERRKK